MAKVCLVVIDGWGITEEEKGLCSCGIMLRLLTLLSDFFVLNYEQGMQSCTPVLP